MSPERIAEELKALAEEVLGRYGPMRRDPPVEAVCRFALELERDLAASQAEVERLKHQLSDEQSWASAQTRRVNELTTEIRALQSSGPEREAERG